MVSIITPCFNPGTLILELFESLVDQLDKSLEWIIVDDGSDEETLQILADIECREIEGVTIKIIRGPNCGACHARNAGFRVSRGQWVKFVDADDLLEPGHLSEQLKSAMLAPKAIIVSPKHDFFDSENEQHIERYSGIDISELKDPFRNMLFAAPFHHSSGLYPRNLIQEIGGWDESLAADQDGDFLLRLLLKRPTLIWCPGPGFLFRQHSYTNRITKDNSPPKWESRLYVCSKMEARLKELGLLDKYRNELALRYDKIAKRALLSSGDNDEWIAKCLKKAQDLSDDYLHLEPKYVLWLRSILGFKSAERFRDRIAKNSTWKRLRYGIYSD